MYSTINYYHVYNRGAHKTDIFKNDSDYLRFVALLYVANDSSRMRANWYNQNYWGLKRSEIVEVISYCLMPNHFHICLRELSENGIEIYLHRLCTAYVMYFNKKYMHSGTIFQGSYQSKYIDNDDYFRYLLQYIHLNPYGIEEPTMNKITKIENYDKAHEYSKLYKYSSYMDYLGVKRNENAIIGGLTSRLNLE